MMRVGESEEHGERSVGTGGSADRDALGPRPGSLPLDHRGCPHCGGSPVLKREESRDTRSGRRWWQYYVACLFCCGAGMTVFFESEQEAWAAWDRRVQ